MTNNVYCIRCDQPGSPDEDDMVSLFQVLDTVESPRWVHRKCFAAHLPAKSQSTLAESSCRADLWRRMTSSRRAEGGRVTTAELSAAIRDAMAAAERQVAKRP